MSPMFVETLETRRHFAVGLVGTQLQVSGSPGNDVIRVSQVDVNTIRVEENGVVRLFNDALVDSFLLNGNTVPLSTPPLAPPLSPITVTLSPTATTTTTTTTTPTGPYAT